MAWLDRLLSGSFRGVPFGIESHRSSGGRRIALHEYPGRSQPYAEDLGRTARGFTLEAWVVGDLYRLNRDALIIACELRDPAPLIHPYLGVHIVSCERYEVHERTTEGRMARFTLTFAESGRGLFPTNILDVASSLEGRIDAATDAVVDGFRGAFGL